MPHRRNCLLNRLEPAVSLTHCLLQAPFSLAITGPFESRPLYLSAALRHSGCLSSFMPMARLV
jgi:hypothetical protein